MSSESVIYNTSELSCTMHVDGPMETSHSGPLYIFRVLSGGHLSTLKLEVDIKEEGAGWFWWPNSEGERGSLSDIHKRLDTRENQTRGLSIIYPISASCRTIIVGDSRGGVILSGMPDKKGRISRINVKAPFHNKVHFTARCGRSRWMLTRYTGGPEEALQWLEKIIHKVKWPLQDPVELPGRNLLQVGLIGPDYDCMVPNEKGFMVLGEIAAVMETWLGRGNWLHVFGYAHGHDILYPDYTPSAYLGGEERLREAIKEVHKRGQKVSFYMNLRIGDENLVENDFRLKDSVQIDALGKPVYEKAHDRSFYIMDPHSQSWQDRLFEEARRLIALGADGLELSHQGKQSFMVPLAEQWGEGIRMLMARIRALGVKIWYRGGIDLYPADWLELSREELIIDQEGRIISGCPLGEFDPRLYMTLVPGRSFLVPLSRLSSVSSVPPERVMRDLENIMGGLFIYNEEYMERIEMILKHTAEEQASSPEGAPS